MTALAGFWRFDGGSDVRESCARMLRSQQIYAREKPVEWSDGDCAMGRALFRLLPEDNHDRRPVSGGAGRLALVADVRLDNRADLARELAIDAERLSDAELVMKAAEAWDELFVGRLIGDFALALFDREKQRLLLARDFLGQRPLHYHRGDGFFAFASMPKGLHALPSIPYAANARYNADFLVSMPQVGPDTFFEGISRVEPGQVCIVDRNGFRSEEYWRPSLETISLGSDAAYAEALRERLDVAVARRLRGVHGPVGAHLSGGLDSSAVCASAAALMEGRKVYAFTSAPDSGSQGPARHGLFSDETRLAAATAELYANVEHVVVRAQHRSPLETLDRNFFLYERPVSNLTNMGWWDGINDEAKARRLTVMLTGQAGNLSFSYAGVDYLPQLFAQGHWLKLLPIALGLRRHGWSSARIVGTIFGPFIPARAWTRLQRVFGRTPQDLIADSCVNPAFERELEKRARERGLDTRLGPRRGSAALRLATLRGYDPGNHNKGMLAAWGLDFRDPTADRELVEFCLRVPSEQFVLGGLPRSLARRALKGRLPDPVLAEMRKGLQDGDWHHAFDRSRDEIEEELERIAGCLPANGVLDERKLAKLVENWPKGGWHDPAVERSYRTGLLMAVSAGHFIRKASGSNS